MRTSALALLAPALFALGSAGGKAAAPDQTIRIVKCADSDGRTKCETSVEPLARDLHRGGPNGSSALCNDGTYSKALHLDPDTCAGHQGVKTWYGH